MTTTVEPAIVPPTIAITMGDPAGIGPEIIVKALADHTVRPIARWVVVGDAEIWREAVATLGINVPAVVVQRLQDAESRSSTIFLDRGQLQGAPLAGKLNAACGRAALEYVRTATLLALHREVDAMVTAPLNKEAVVLAGEHFTGHTEYIAELCGAADSRMLLINDRLRVVHVTTHCSLRRACEPTVERILRTIELGHESLQLLGFQSPRIAVCGLNPHAGENGLFGNEDRAPTPEQVDQHEAELKKHGKNYEFHRYDGAGHGFFYYDRPAYRIEQALDGWQKVWAFCNKHLSTK